MKAEGDIVYMRGKSRKDKLFLYSLLPFGGIILALFILLFKTLAENSMPIFLREGIHFILSNNWKPSETNSSLEYYGILSPIIGTIYTSLIALILALPSSIALTVFINELLPYNLKDLFINLVEVMAGLPTVIYGLWGALILAPILRDYVMAPIHKYLWFIPFFSCNPLSPLTIFTAGVILAIMITPFITSIIREAYESIPLTYREAILSLGTTSYEYVKIMLSMIKPAVIAAVLLGFGRAAGETIAVSMTIGNSFSLTTCLFAPGYTISSLIANQFGNAGFYHYMMNALYGAGLILLLIGVVLNTIGLYVLGRWRKQFEES